MWYQRAHRKKFRKNMLDIGLDLPKSKVVNHVRDAAKVLKQIGLPAIIRPAFTLGGLGGGIAKTEKELIKLNHYTNFQPLWKIENIKKGNKLLTQF